MLLLATVLAPARALASPADVAATQAYLQANYRLVSTAASHIPVAERAISAVLGQVRRECPKAASGSPQDPESTQMSEEVIGTMVTSAYSRDLASIRQYLRAVAHLRWSNHALTAEVQSYVSRLKVLASLTQPNLCADVRSWATSHYTALPASNVAFDRRFVPSWVSLGEVPGSLARYENAEAHALAKRSASREEQISEFEAFKVETWGQIMSTLELWP
jgi:hypothetical protein